MAGFTKTPDSRSISNSELAEHTDAPHRSSAPRSNLIIELCKACKEDHRSVPNLAEMARLSLDSIKALLDGAGPVSTLIAVMEALPFRLTGLAPGSTFAEQLHNKRIKRRMSVEVVAAKASLAPSEIVELEMGRGSMQNLLSLLSVIAPTVKRRAKERAYWGMDKKVERDSRFTPASFMTPIYHAFGKVDLDPCAHPSSPVIARRRFFLTDGDDGLTNSWSGRFAFVNPPFSSQLKWLRRANHEWEAGHVETIVCLVPTRTDSAFFQETIIAKADIYFLRGRIGFLNEEGKSQATPFSLQLVVFGATAQQKARFAACVPGFWFHAAGTRTKSTKTFIALSWWTGIFRLWVTARPKAV